MKLTSKEYDDLFHPNFEDTLPEDLSSYKRLIGSIELGTGPAQQAELPVWRLGSQVSLGKVFYWYVTDLVKSQNGRLGLNKLVTWQPIVTRFSIFSCLICQWHHCLWQFSWLILWLCVTTLCSKKEEALKEEDGTRRRRRHSQYHIIRREALFSIRKRMKSSHEVKGKERKYLSSFDNSLEFVDQMQQ